MSEGKRQATFMMAGGQTIKGMNIEQFERYLKHIEEEVSELRRDYEAGDMVKVVDALMDIKVVCNGASLSLGIDPDEGMKIVDTANMSKIGPDGKVSRRPDGQIAKGEFFQPPEPRLRELMDKAGVPHVMERLA